MPREPPVMSAIFSCEFHVAFPFAVCAMLHCRRGRTKVGAMLIARTLAELARRLRLDLRATHGALALVPTMGALHDGHRALVRAAVASGAAVVTSIFVNPLQFGASEDLSRYPRDEAGDLATLRSGRLRIWCGCRTWRRCIRPVTPRRSTWRDPAETWEGTARPGHFRGVATVCAKLFGQVRPDRAYFGEKDWQQLQVVTPHGRRSASAAGDRWRPDGARTGWPRAVVAQPVS